MRERSARRMSRQRKQKLTVREEAGGVVAVAAATTGGGVAGVCMIRGHDPFLPGAAEFSPPSLLQNTLSPPVTPSGVIGLNYLSSDELGDAMATFLDAIPHFDTSPSILDSSPISLTHDVFSKEVFQDLKHTSTPKCNSGSLQVVSRTTKKRLKFNEPTSGRVLHDITASFHQSGASTTGSFVNILNNSESESGFVEEEDYENTSQEELTTSHVKRVPIIRRNILKRSSTPRNPQNVYKEFSGGWSDLTDEEKNKIAYYTGIEGFDVAKRVLRGVSVPTEGCLGKLEVQLITLMRLRLNLEWKDLALRFNVEEAMVVRLFYGALGALAGALRWRIPWQEGPPSDPTAYSTTIHVHPVYFKDDSVRQILVCLSNKEVVFVSSPQEEGQDDSQEWWSSELRERLRPGDHVVYSGQKYTVLPGGCLSVCHQPAPQPPPILNHLTRYKMFAGKFRSTKAVATWVLIVISAVANAASSL